MVELLQFEFMQNAFLAAILTSIVCGVIGSFVVIRRLVFISSGIAHAAFGGIGIGYYLGINPLLGILPFSLLSALGIGVISQRKWASEDSLIGIFWAVGMSIGVIFIGLTPGYAPDLFSYLFGSILTVPRSDLFVMSGLCVSVLLVVYAFYRPFVAMCFEEESAQVLGIPVGILYLVLLCLIAVAVVIMVRIVGIVLVIALLTIPATIARQYTHNLKRMMLLAIAIGIGCTFGGLYLSYKFDLASGATIIVVSGLAFIMSVLVPKKG